MKGIDESRIVLRKRLLEDKCTKSVFRKQISLCFNLLLKGLRGLAC